MLRERYNLPDSIADETLMMLQHYIGTGDIKVYLKELMATGDYDAAQEAVNKSILTRLQKKNPKAVLPKNKPIINYLNEFIENLNNLPAEETTTPTGIAAVTPAPMPEARKSTMVEKAPEPKVEVKPKPKVQPKTIVKSEPPKQPLQSNYNFSGTVNTQPVKTQPAKKEAPAKPLSRQEVAQKVKSTFNITLTEEQLDVATNPKLSVQEKLIELGFIEKPKIIDNSEERSFLVKAWDSLFGEDSVPLKVTIQAKNASSGEDLHEEKEVKNAASPLAQPAKVPVQQPVKPTAPKKEIKNTTTVKQPPAPDNSKRKQEFDNFAESRGFKKLTNKLYRGKSYQNIDQGTYSRAIIDMSEGITVTYQPRNERNKDRGDVDNALIVSDYLYDHDFTDEYYHDYAIGPLKKLKEALWKPADWDKRTYVNDKGETVPVGPWRKDMFKMLDGRKFVTVRENLGGGKYRAKIKKIDDLTQADFTSGKVYRQGYAKLSDFDITPDQKKIKLFAKKDAFVGQGLPYRDEKNAEHGLRVGGGKGNVSVNLKGETINGYYNIANLNQFGMYLGGTVTIISDDGRVAYKVTGSMKDILETAFHIKEKTNSKEIYFLQSDSGSMNQKADAVGGKIKRSQLVITRNKDTWAGAAEVLLNE